MILYIASGFRETNILVVVNLLQEFYAARRNLSTLGMSADESPRAHKTSTVFAEDVDNVAAEVKSETRLHTMRLNAPWDL
jgi:hypothetical protein